MDLSSLKCKKVIEFFRDINRIPRGSGNEKGISDYLADFARQRGLEVIQDEANNILIRKKASLGCETKQPVILQGHMDMVCVKKSNADHNFLTDPIELVFDGDYIRANGTTLGADDGIAVAIAMAVLDDETIEHPPLEALITTDEEVGMGGARLFDTSLLRGRLLMNIDSEDEGIFTAGCAGGARADIYIPFNCCGSRGKFGYRLKVGGLKGGHSGIDIDKGRANANVILARAINHLKNDVEIEVGCIFGGDKDNAIPCESYADIAVNNDIELEKSLYRLNNELTEEYAATDGKINVSIDMADVPDRVFTEESLERVLSAVMLVPCGVVSMSGNIKGLPETSNNIGCVTTEEGTVKLVCAMRSAVKTRKEWLKAVIGAAAKMCGGKAVFRADYPAWEYNVNSYIRPLMAETYERLFGKKAVVDIIHAGLECGLLGEKCPELDMISFGPNIRDIHSPDERLSISSLERTYMLVLEALRTIE